MTASSRRHRSAACSGDLATTAALDLPAARLGRQGRGQVAELGEGKAVAPVGQFGDAVAQVRQARGVERQQLGVLA